MKFIELQKYGDYSVIVRQDDKGNPIAIEPFVAAYGVNKQDGEVIDWGFGHYFDDLFSATDFARSRGSRYMQYPRLEEIASKAIDGLVEDDEDSAYEYFANEIEIDSHEAEYFGLNPELLDDYK
jgi:hypothetical protein